MTADTAFCDAVAFNASTRVAALASTATCDAVGVDAHTTRIAETAVCDAVGVPAISLRWFAVFDSTTGVLLSVGTSVGELAQGTESVELAWQPNLRTEVWDEATRAFVPRPPKVYVNLVDRIMAALEDVDISGEQRAQIHEILDAEIDPGVR